MKIFKVTLLALVFSLISIYTSMAQDAMQTVSGTIIDKQSEMPLIGATIEIISTVPTRGTTTDADGSFSLSDIPVGRQIFRVSYIGYNTFSLPNVVVTSGKEVILNISMEESITALDEVVVTASVEKDRANNEMATISARSFSLEEVTRYSGGRNDVARLAGSFAGVSTADDSRNDIVIRGNSPTGVLWRLEGIPIDNPNHFATLGTTGGPVSALNTNLLRNSDFMTSAFPAEYGNANAGVFDIGFRNGNKNNYEFTAQLAAFSGMEAMIEGPLSSKKNSSFLVSYRHSFVEIADIIGIPIGTNATPNYKDLSFKLDFANGRYGKFSFFGIGGLSDIDFLGDEVDENDLFAEPGVDAYPRSKLGVIGMNHRYLIDDRTYLRTTIATSTAQSDYSEDRTLSDASKESQLEISDINNRISISSYLNKKFSARHTLRVGILGEVFRLDSKFRSRTETPDWVTVRDFTGNLALLQAYGQSQYKISEQLTLNTGLHFQFLDFNDHYVVEPRIAINYHLNAKSTLNFAYGLHSQMQALPIYLLSTQQADGSYAQTNADLDFAKSNHFVVSYDLKLNTDWRVKTEIYYQQLFDIAVEKEASSFSVLNAGADFVFPEVANLVNEGKGQNYGLELTVEKFFSQGYYGLLTGSVFESTYEGSDGVERNTAFNNNYVLNFLAGKEFKIGKTKRHALSIDLKVTRAGGRFYTPVDLESSRLAGEELLFEDRAFSEQYDPYFRFDFKIGVQLNSKKRKFAQQFFLDFQNVTNNQNVFANRYNPQTNQVNTVYQSGFFPDLLYRVQF